MGYEVQYSFWVLALIFALDFGVTDMLGNFLKAQSMGRDLYPNQMAKAMGISEARYIELEEDKREPNPREARMLATLFNLSVADLCAQNVSNYVVDLEKPRPFFEADAQAYQRHEDFGKAKQVILYVLTAMANKPTFNQQVLHKLLYFIDFDYYDLYDKNLMGLTYIKERQGPAAIALPALMAVLIKEGALRQVDGHWVDITKPQRLSTHGQAHIDSVLQRLGDKNARQISDYSHGDVPWRVTEYRQPMSYGYAFYRGAPYALKNFDDEL